MLILQDELVASFMIEDRLRQAELRYLLTSIPTAPSRLTRAVAAAGRLLVATGTRLEAHASRRQLSHTWFLNADPCPDCGC